MLATALWLNWNFYTALKGEYPSLLFKEFIGTLRDYFISEPH